MNAEAPLIASSHGNAEVNASIICPKSMELYFEDVKTYFLGHLSRCTFHHVAQSGEKLQISNWCQNNYNIFPSNTIP